MPNDTDPTKLAHEARIEWDRDHRSHYVHELANVIDALVAERDLFKEQKQTLGKFIRATACSCNARHSQKCATSTHRDYIRNLKEEIVQRSIEESDRDLLAHYTGLTTELTRLRDENAFLHHRRGELVIERDGALTELRQVIERRDKLAAQIGTMTAENARLRAALKFYSRREDYPFASGALLEFTVTADMGNTARAALAQPDLETTK